MVEARRIKQKPVGFETRQKYWRKRGMTIEQILHFAPAEPDIRNAQYVSFEELQNVGMLNHPMIISRTITAIPDEEERHHYQMVRPRNASYRGTLFKCPAVVIECDCARFLFMWEWALHHHGAAEILHSNGDAPDYMNPEYIPGCCKHQYIMLNFIRSNKI
jgi:hypothetical protein